MKQNINKLSIMIQETPSHVPIHHNTYHELLV